MVSAKGRREKGKKFERDVRDQLKRIYTDVNRRSAIHRVPMSGASYTKGDVIDLNDTDWSYECKKQETLSLPQWWRQSKAQAQPHQTPVLVFSSNNRPIYWVMHIGDYESYEGATAFDGVVEYVPMTTTKIYDKLAGLNQIQVATVKLSGDEVVVIPNELYIALRKELHDGQEA